MSNIRTLLVEAAAAYLESLPTPVPVLRDCDDETVSPPYALFQIGGAEAMFPGQVDIWDITLLCAVVHDGDATTSATAQSEAEAVFSLLADPTDFIAHCSDTILMSAFETISTELMVQDGRWQHIAGFRAVCAPAD